MKTCITGALGFIGTHTVRRLAQDGHELVCLVRKTSTADWLREMGATVVTGDVMDRDSVRAAMQGCDWVIHLANLYSFWQPDPRLYAAVNVGGTRNVMECALEVGVSKVIHISTAAVYGKPADCPFAEESQVGPARFSEYARTKYAGDLIAWELHEKKGLPLVVLYPGVVLGPGDPKFTGLYIRDFIRGRVPATGFNDSVFTYVHVRDVANAIARALEKPDNVGEKYLLGSELLSNLQYSELISNISGAPMPKLNFPGFLILLTAAVLTGAANLLKRPPVWAMSRDRGWVISLDSMRTTREGFRFHGGKAARELGIAYTPIRRAIEESIRSYAEKPAV
jgi:dihydroflavonol-4-reductase